MTDTEKELTMMEKKAERGLSDHRLTPNAKVLYFFLCNGADQIDGGHWINGYTQDRLRQITGMASKTTLQKAIKNLVDHDLIQVMKHRNMNVYIIK